MRIYNPQNQFGKDLVTKELVSQKLLAITGYNLDATEPLAKGTLQAQIDNIVGGGLKYKVMGLGTETDPAKGTWRWLKSLIDKSSKTTEEEAEIEQYVKTIILVNEREGKSGNIYTEYLVFDKGTEGTHNYAYEKIGEIGGDVSELVSRIETLEKAKVSDITSAGDQSAAITITHTADPTTTSGTEWTITANKASTTAYGVVKLSTAGAAGSDTELVVTEKQLSDARVALETKINNLVKATTTAVGQVHTATIAIVDGNKDGLLTVSPLPDNASSIKILAVEDNTGEQWSYKLNGEDTTGAQFRVWNDGDYTQMASGTAPTSFTVSYAVMALTTQPQP